MKDQICNIFAISISELTWEKYRDDFVKKISRIDSEINIDLKQSTGMCIGMQRHNGVKVAYDNSLRQLLGKVNFSKTSADLCSIIIYTGELKIKRKFELGKNLKFSMKASDSTKKVTVELLLIGDNGKVMNAKYEISASEDWTDYKEYK